MDQTAIGRAMQLRPIVLLRFGPRPSTTRAKVGTAHTHEKLTPMFPNTGIIHRVRGRTRCSTTPNSDSERELRTERSDRVGLAPLPDSTRARPMANVSSRYSYSMRIATGKYPVAHAVPHSGQRDRPGGVSPPHGSSPHVGPAQGFSPDIMDNQSSRPSNCCYAHPGGVKPTSTSHSADNCVVRLHRPGMDPQ